MALLSSWLVLREAVRSFALNRDMADAATLAYYGFLALMPLLLLVVFLLGLFMQSSESVLAGMEDLAARLFPAFDRALLQDLLALTRQRVWGIVGVAVLLWSLMPFAGAIRSALARIFKATQGPSFLRAKLLDLLAVLALLVLFVLLSAGKVYASLTPVRMLARAGDVWAWGRSLIPLLLASGVLAFFYRVFAPGRVRPGHVIAGALSAAVLLAVIRPVFGLVLRINPDYGYAFGSLKAIFLLIVWVYYTFAAMFFGAEVMATAHRRDALLLGRLFTGDGRSAPAYRALLGRFVRVGSPGEVLFEEGAPGAEMFYILRGAVELSRGRQVLRVMRKGDYFGEMSMLLGAPRTASATIIEPETELVIIEKKNFDVILRENPRIVLDLLKEMARRLKTTDEKMNSA